MKIFPFINRRRIANEFNKYFVSLASNLNEAYSEIGELEINPIPSFYDYLPNSNLSSIYMGDCCIQYTLSSRAALGLPAA